MILNTFAILLASVAILRLLLGGLVLLGSRGRGLSLQAQEERAVLVFLLAFLLLGLNLGSWPLLYLLLQSYVAEWPGVMCMYGVTRIGAGSEGVSRFLPGLLGLLQLSKPALIFVGGGWFVLYLLNRRTPTGLLTPRLFRLLSLVGGFAMFDAVAELAYIAIPKKAEFPRGGCCMEAFTDPVFSLPTDPLIGSDPLWLWLAFYGATALLVLGLWLSRRLLLLQGANLLVLLLGGLFLVDVAAPVFLRLPYHRCVYDLVGQAPLALVAVGLYVGGCFLLGWVGLVRILGQGAETVMVLPGMIRSLLRLSLVGVASGIALLTLGLAWSGTSPPRVGLCSMHGLSIEQRYRVRLVEAECVREFCCIRCAQAWIMRRGQPPTQVLVTDETEGTELDANAAFFVISAVITNPVTGNRIHAFRHQAHAEAHAEAFAGQILRGVDWPFVQEK